ncbi:hypothetical protein [Roseateles sp.]|uniref:hypothetical protein n=1 Tax=Roseateles sp. TaxID=1971397 RepID=UPI002DFCC697|nr:hypothetical protein [Roseateles sp.]
MAQTAYGRPFDPLSTMAALHLYFTGKVTFGDVMQSASAFGSLKSALSFFSQAYFGFAQ